MPPAAVTVWLYEEATVAAGTAAGASVIVGAPMVRLYAALPVYGPVPVELSVAVTVKLKTPPALGVPDKAPELLRVNPAGSAPAVSE